MKEVEKIGISRRSFLGSLAAAGTVTALGGLVACSPGQASDSKSNNSEEIIAPPQVDEVLDVDVVIAGAGISGLAAAVQAALDGNQVLLLEKGNQVGGNGIGVEGMFAVESTLQQAAGIHIEPRDIIMAEAEAGQFRADGSLWMDMITKSAENIDWCIEQGVEYSGTVDNYYTGLYPTMHWFKEGHASVGYIPQMEARAQELGVEFRLETAAELLISDNGTIVGLYAKTSDGTYLQINAGAVILATGGIGNNVELIAKQGWGKKAEKLILGGHPAIDGDGYKMAMEVGANDFLPNSCQLGANFVPATGMDSTPPYDDPLNSTIGFFAGGPILWVNQDAKRYVDESVFTKNLQLQFVAMKNNRSSYVIFDSAAIDELVERAPEVKEVFAKSLEDNEGDSLYAVNSIEELAEPFGLDKEALTASVNRYNELCKSGDDLDFGKDASMMTPIEKAPLYIGRIENSVIVTIGAISTNERAEVLDTDLNAIPGLYAIGVDGAMLYRNVYTINMPGTCCANNINSGRGAAQAATDYIKKNGN